MSTPRISIVVVTWNSAADLEVLLPSIAAQDIEHELIVVDNASSDQTIATLVRLTPQATIIKNQHNVGFAAANNQGIALAQGEYILLLNPDTKLGEDTLREAVAAATRHPEAWIVAVQLRHPDGTVQRSVRRFPSWIVQVLILLKLHHVLRSMRALRSYFGDDIDYAIEQRVEQPAGAFLFCRADRLRELGGLDAGYWIWYEEVDLCQRVYAAGGQIWYVPKGSVMHTGGVSFARVRSMKKQWLMSRSMYRYMYRHQGAVAAIALLPSMGVGLLLAVVVTFFGFKRKRYDY
jgi:N-acetylglucosaminyl-diphospho-decaprenol L-rhamnosyltransferase